MELQPQTTTPAGSPVKSRVRLRHVAEYAILSVIGFCLCHVPFSVGLGFAWLCAAISFVLMPARNAETIRRLREVFGDSLSEKEVRNISWRSWQNFFFNSVEALRFPCLTADNLNTYINLDVEIALINEYRSGDGLILATPHMGNWELAGVAARLRGIPVFVIVRRQKNPLTNAYLTRLRTITGVEALVVGELSIRDVIRKIKDGKVLAILPDIRARTDAVPVTFLGAQTNIPAGMAMFARLSKVPILPMVGRRVGWKRHEWHALNPVYPDFKLDKDEDILRMTRTVMEQFDEVIRKQPEQFFWYNKKWIRATAKATSSKDGSDS